MEFKIFVLSWLSDFQGVALFVWQKEGSKFSKALLGIALKFEGVIQLDLFGYSFNYNLLKTQKPPEKERLEK